MKILYFNGQPDYMQVMLLEGFVELHRKKEIELRVLNPIDHKHADLEGMPVVGEEGMVMSVDWADLIIFDASGGHGWMSDKITPIYNDLQLRGKKIVFVDGGDNHGWHENPHTFVAYFKREVRQPTWMFQPSPLVRSLSFCMLKKFQPKPPDGNNYMAEHARRNIDISFVATNTNGIRLQFGQFIMTMAKSNPELNVIVDVKSGKVPMTEEAYFNILDRSKIAISCPGMGFDTKRFWEIPGHGAVLASYDISYRMFIRDMFEHNRHALYFDSFQQAFGLLTTVLANPPVWCMMRYATDQWCQRHTTEYRAQQLIGMSVECKSFMGNVKRSAL